MPATILVWIFFIVWSVQHSLNFIERKLVKKCILPAVLVVLLLFFFVIENDLLVDFEPFSDLIFLSFLLTVGVVYPALSAEIAAWTEYALSRMTKDGELRKIQEMLHFSPGLLLGMSRWLPFYSSRLPVILPGPTGILILVYGVIYAVVVLKRRM